MTFSFTHSMLFILSFIVAFLLPLSLHPIMNNFILKKYVTFIFKKDNTETSLDVFI